VPNNEDGFLIERCSGKGKCTIFVQIAQTGADGNGFSQTGLNPMTAYIYRVGEFGFFEYRKGQNSEINDPCGADHRPAGDLPPPIPS